MTTTTLCYIENDDKFLMLHRVKKQDDMNEGNGSALAGMWKVRKLRKNALFVR